MTKVPVLRSLPSNEGGSQDTTSITKKYITCETTSTMERGSRAGEGGAFSAGDRLAGSIRWLG